MSGSQAPPANTGQSPLPGHPLMATTRGTPSSAASRSAVRSAASCAARI